MIEAYNLDEFRVMKSTPSCRDVKSRVYWEATQYVSSRKLYVFHDFVAIVALFLLLLLIPRVKFLYFSIGFFARASSRVCVQKVCKDQITRNL